MKRALSITLVLAMALSLMIITPLSASASCPFEALTGKYQVVAIKGGLPADSFRVGEVFKNVIGTVEYNYSGMNSVNYGHNPKWWINGMPIEKGYVFNQVGRYTMTLQCEMTDKEYNAWKKKGIKLPSKTAVASYQFSVLPNVDWQKIVEFTLTSSMSKTTYRQGADEFDPTSILVRAGIGKYKSGQLEITDYKDLDWEDLTFYAGGRGMKHKEDGVQITKGYRFWAPGEKDLWVVVANKQIVIPFTVTPFVSSVKLTGVPTMTAGSTIRTSNFSVQANYKDGTSEVIGGDSLGISVNGQRMYKGGEYDVPSGKSTISLSMGDFSIKGTSGELIGKTASESEEAKNTRIVTVAIDKLVEDEWYKSWDDGQGEIKYTVNGGKPEMLFKEGGTPAVKTFSAKVGDKVQVIWTTDNWHGTNYALEGQVYVYYQDNPASNISDSSRILGSIPAGKVNPAGNNVVASFTVGAIKTTPASVHEKPAAPTPTPTPKTETVTAKPTNANPSSTPKKSADYGKPPTALTGMSQKEWDVLRLTNIERAKKGLTLLVTFDALNAGGGIRALEIGSKFSHERPDGSGPNTVMKELGYKYTAFGENVARGQKSAAEVVKDWMNSEGHRANILLDSYRHLGVGNSGNCWVQLFSTDSGSKATSIEYNEALGYFTLTLKSGVTAYAPYDAVSSPTKDGKVTFNYPGVETIVNK